MTPNDCTTTLMRGFEPWEIHGTRLPGVIAVTIRFFHEPATTPFPDGTPIAEQKKVATAAWNIHAAEERRLMHQMFPVPVDLLHFKHPVSYTTKIIRDALDNERVCADGMGWLFTRRLSLSGYMPRASRWAERLYVGPIPVLTTAMLARMACLAAAMGREDAVAFRMALLAAYGYEWGLGVDADTIVGCLLRTWRNRALGQTTDAEDALSWFFDEAAGLRLPVNAHPDATRHLHGFFNLC